eukprot:tig00000403_g338.t1
MSDAPAPSTSAVKPPHIDAVVVHPLVLLSAVDHYNRVAKDTKKRVVGILLGEISKGRVDITNCYAVPFEEDEKDINIWFLDHDYHENMYAMFKKVNARENVVGWYSTGPKLRTADIEINEVVRRYTPHPVLVIIDVQPRELGLPTEAYLSVEQVKEDGTPVERTWAHVPSEIGALEAEEIGVEHLLRDVKDINVSTLAMQVHAKLSALKGLQTRIKEIHTYLDLVTKGTVPPNHELIGKLQDVFNLLPNLQQETLQRSFAVATNDMMLVIYLASLIRSVTALHDLINNKIANKEAEKAEEAGKDGDKDKDKKKDGKEKKGKEEKEEKKEKEGKKDKDVEMSDRGA